MAEKRNILLLFDRPQEPVFVGKGDNQAVFDIPNEYFTERYKPIGVELFNRFGEDAGERIPVKKISLPDLSEILELSRHDNFSIFLPKHRRLAGRLIDIFLGMRSVEDLQSMAVYARDRVNPYLFNYALSVALLNREDTHDVDVPSFIHSFPDKYVDPKVFSRAREETSIVPESNRLPIEIPRNFTASDAEPEHRLAYFREDLGLNLHHWHWHLVYPFEGARNVVDKDRRGELFYYMHQQIMARYNFERFSNNMGRVERFSDWRGPIREPYFPKLDSLVASRTWPARPANQRLQDVNRPVDQVQVDVDDLYRWRDRIFAAIQAGFVQNEQGNRIPLTEDRGIDILGNIIESSILSVNRPFYGDIHNMGHILLSYIHDPNHRNLESFGVMGDSATAMRDPVFYRWHAYIDDMFQTYKATLPTYTTAQLGFPQVSIQNISLVSQGGRMNELSTFWQQSDLDLSRGMDFQPRGPVFVRFTHLQHQNYNYSIVVNNAGSMREGTCRIFLAPKFNEGGQQMPLADQRNMFIELDKFRVTLRPGRNTINRQSLNSSVTIPFERTFRNLDLTRPVGGAALEQFNFCGCGWPHHMLIPKGNAAGMVCQLFVMISNYANDRVNQTLTGLCNDAESYCGVKDRLYPDRRAMGFPFDRPPRDSVGNIQQFLTPNMRVQDVIIRFSEKVVRRPRIG